MARTAPKPPLNLKVWATFLNVAGPVFPRGRSRISYAHS
jgi:hypothetical protein